MDMTQPSLLKKRIPLFSIVVLSLLFSVSLIAARVYFTEKVTFVFLVWNLFLAAIPFVISSVLVVYQHKLSRVVLFSGFLLWLLFFPNAPYILTDLFHLKERAGVPLWFDLMVILSAAWNGLILGLLSLQDIQHVISKRFSVIWSWVARYAFVGIVWVWYLCWPLFALEQLGCCYQSGWSYSRFARANY
jgi:uncharacterized membrane protein